MKNKLAGTFLAMVVLGITSCYDCEKSMQKIKDHNLKCVVVALENDKQNRNAPTVFLNCPQGELKQLYLTKFEFPILYNYAIRGDTIIKEKNSLRFKLVKRDTAFYFYPQCDGKQIR